MRLILGDLHLLNEANDRYNKVIPNIQSALERLDLLKYIEAVDLVGDVLDCEYVTYKRISYFSFVMDLIGENFSENRRLLIGNHDKYFKNDEHKENIIRYINFDGEILDAPTIMDRILYVPHYYNKENFPAGLLNPDDFDIIVGHFGIEFVNGVEELTIEEIRKHFKRKPIISGHIHNMDLAFSENIFFLGSLKSESWKEQCPVYSVCVLNGIDPSFIVFPYHKMHLMLEVRDEDAFREDLLRVFKRVHEHNLHYIMYNKDGDVIGKEPCDKYMTSMINIKFKVFNKDIKKGDIDNIVEYCKHEIDDPSFIGIAVKSLYHIENEDNSGLQDKPSDKAKIDKSILIDKKKDVYDLIDGIKEGNKMVNLGKNKKFIKMVEAITDGEVERFAEFLVFSDKSKEFKELLGMIS